MVNGCHVEAGETFLSWASSACRGVLTGDCSSEPATLPFPSNKSDLDSHRRDTATACASSLLEEGASNENLVISSRTGDLRGGDQGSRKCDVSDDARLIV